MMRALLGGVAAVAAAAAAVGVFSLARAVAPVATYDCHGSPVCEYVKIERASPVYQYDAEMQLFSGEDPGTILYSWSETNPKSTLWHWYSTDRDHVGDLKVHVKVTARAGNSRDLGDLDQVFSAYQSWCIKIDEHGAHPSSDCLAGEDLRRNRG